MKKLLIVALVCSVPLVLNGCSDSFDASINALGKQHIIKQFSGGKLIGQWTSTGKISNESQSDGYYFEDADTHLLVMVSGTVQITVKP